MADRHLNIAMLGHKHMLSREGGIEIVVKELATRMAARGNRVICYDRKTHHVSGSEIDARREFNGVKIVPVWTIERKGLAALTSSISAAWKASRSKADIVHIHAEGPAAMCGLVKLFGKKKGGKKKRVIVTIHGACEIIGTTGEKPVKSRLHGDSVFYPNSKTEYQVKIKYSGFLKRFCAVLGASRRTRRTFSCRNPFGYRVFRLKNALAAAA